jgi:hypothetical protein
MDYRERLKGIQLWFNTVYEMPIYMLQDWLLEFITLTIYSASPSKNDIKQTYIFTKHYYV